MPLSGWSRPTGLLNYPDCSPEGLGIPDLGEVNVTLRFAISKNTFQRVVIAVSRF